MVSQVYYCPKFVEIRDAATFIPALAIEISGADGYLARRAGFGERCVELIHLASQRCAYDPYEWNNRTMQAAHLYLIKEWDAICDGQVVDVQFILGETLAPKWSEEYKGA